VVIIHLGQMPVYVPTTATTIRDALGANARNLIRGRIQAKARPLIGNGIVISDGEYHRRQRVLMQPAFHRDRIVAYAATMSKEAQITSDSWHDGGTVDLDQELRHMALRITTRTLFNADTAAATIREVERSLPIALAGFTWRAIAPDILSRLPLPANRRFDTACQRLRDAFTHIIHVYRDEATDQGDLLSLLLAARYSDSGEGMTDEQLGDEIVAITMAGIETTAVLLSWLFHELGQHPQIEQRLHAELDTALGQAPIDAGTLTRLPYLQAVMTETARLHPPIWMTMRHATTDLQLGSSNVPAGAELLISPALLHHDPHIYPNPLQFDPNRWIINQAVRKPARGTYIPFGYGNTKCMGDVFAWTEIAIFVATVATTWKMRPLPDFTVRQIPHSTLHPQQLPMTTHHRHP
jgi:cytochrome P450